MRRCAGFDDGAWHGCVSRSYLVSWAEEEAHGLGFAVVGVGRCEGDAALTGMIFARRPGRCVFLLNAGGLDYRKGTAKYISGRNSCFLHERRNHEAETHGDFSSDNQSH